MRALVRDLAALRVFETPRPKSGAKYGAIVTLLGLGVPEEGLRVMVQRAPWLEENKEKWYAQLAKIARKVTVCPFCVYESDPDCPVAKYMATDEAHRSRMEVDLFG